MGPSSHVTCPTAHVPTDGFTLVEMLMGVAIISIVAVALLGAFLGQSYLRTNARNLTAAMGDATRVMEFIRQQNVGCAIPSARPPAGSASWDAWLNAQNPGKSVNLPLTSAQRNLLESVAVTCRDEANSLYCGDKTQAPNPAQVGSGEWAKQTNTNTTFDPIRVTVAVGWREGQRVVGGSSGTQEFIYSWAPVRPGGILARGLNTINEWIVPSAEAGGGGPPPSKQVRPSDANGNGVVESQAMLTTLITCR